MLVLLLSIRLTEPPSQELRTFTAETSTVSSRNLSSGIKIRQWAVLKLPPTKDFYGVVFALGGTIASVDGRNAAPVLVEAELRLNALAARCRRLESAGLTNRLQRR